MRRVVVWCVCQQLPLNASLNHSATERRKNKKKKENKRDTIATLGYYYYLYYFVQNSFCHQSTDQCVSGLTSNPFPTVNIPLPNRQTTQPAIAVLGNGTENSGGLTQTACNQCTPLPLYSWWKRTSCQAGVAAVDQQLLWWCLISSMYSLAVCFRR